MNVKLMKHVGYMFGQICDCAIFGWFAYEDQKSVSASQARFPQIRVIGLFCVKRINKHNDRRAL